MTALRLSRSVGKRPPQAHLIQRSTQTCRSFRGSSDKSSDTRFTETASHSVIVAHCSHAFIIHGFCCRAYPERCCIRRVTLVGGRRVQHLCIDFFASAAKSRQSQSTRAPAHFALYLCRCCGAQGTQAIAEVLHDPEKQARR